MRVPGCKDVNTMVTIEAERSSDTSDDQSTTEDSYHTAHEEGANESFQTANGEVDGTTPPRHANYFSSNSIEEDNSNILIAAATASSAIAVAVGVDPPPVSISKDLPSTNKRTNPDLPPFVVGPRLGFPPCVGVGGGVAFWDILSSSSGGPPSTTTITTTGLPPSTGGRGSKPPPPPRSLRRRSRSKSPTPTPTPTPTSSSNGSSPSQSHPPQPAIVPGRGSAAKALAKKKGKARSSSSDTNTNTNTNMNTNTNYRPTPIPTSSLGLTAASRPPPPPPQSQPPTASGTSEKIVVSLSLLSGKGIEVSTSSNDEDKDENEDTTPPPTTSSNDGNGTTTALTVSSSLLSSKEASKRRGVENSTFSTTTPTTGRWKQPAASFGFGLGFGFGFGSNGDGDGDGDGDNNGHDGNRTSSFGSNSNTISTSSGNNVATDRDDVVSTTDTLMNEESLKKLCDKETDGSCHHGNTGTRYHLMMNLVEFANNLCTPEKISGNELSLNKLQDRLCQDLSRDAEIDPEFSRFLFSTAANIILMKDCESLLEDEQDFLTILVDVGIWVKYYYIPQFNKEVVDPGSDYYRKFKKYTLDSGSYRGLINICSRETKAFCDCMKGKKAEAKTMEKNGFCYGCLETLPKKDLKLCGGCLGKQYCGKKCQKNNWLAMHNSTCSRSNFQRCDKCNILIPEALLPSHQESCSCDED